MLRFLSLALVASSILPAGSAQELPRERALGIVRNVAGQPWANATVHLFGVTSSADPSYETDRVTTRTDAGGRFRAEILTGRSYHAWATGHHPGTRYRTSTITDVRPGAPVTIHEAKGPFHRRLAQLENREDIERAGKLRAVIRILWPARINLNAERTKDGWQLPELPAADSAWLTLVMPSGATVDTVGSDLPHIGGSDPIDLSIKKRAIEIRSAPDAHVFWQISTRMLRIGTTDKRGHATLQMLEHGGFFPYGRIFLAKAGHAPKRVHLDEERGQFTAQLTQSKPTIATVRLTKDHPAAGILLESPIPDGIWFDENGPLIGSLRADKAGRVSLLTNEPPDTHLVACLRTRDIAAFPSSWRTGLSARAILGPIGSAPGLHFILDEHAPVDLQIRTPNGAPASGARVVFDTSPTNPLILTADKLGRLRIIIPNNAPVCLGVHHETGYRFRRVYRTHGARTPQATELRLTAPKIIRGRVVDAQGQAVVGATVSQSSVKAPTDLPPPGDFAASDDVQWFDPVNPKALQRVARLLGKSIKTGAGGQFSMPVPDQRLRYELLARYYMGRGKLYSSRFPVRVVIGSESPDRIELRLPDLRK